MQISYEESSSKTFYVGAFVVSIVFHGLLAILFQTPLQAKETKKEIWVEMTVKEKPPPPPEEPPPEIPPEKKEPPPKPKKKKVKKKPKEIDFKDIPKDLPPKTDEPPPQEKKQVRRVQGLKATSFAQNGTSGLQVRAGTTLNTQATDEVLSLEEAKDSTAISYAAATKQPRLKKRPKLDIPDVVKKEGIEGSVKIVIDIDETGTVRDTRLIKSLHPDADKACLISWKTAVFTPAEQNGENVAISNFPRRCRFQAL